MSPFLKLLASVSSLAIVSSNFFTAKVAKAMETDRNNNVPIVRMNSAAQEGGDEQFANLVDTLVDSDTKSIKKEEIKVAQAVILPGQGRGPGNGIGPGGEGPPGLVNQGNQGNPDFTGNAGGDAS